MLGLSDIRDYLKTLNIADHYYVGKLDNKQERSVGVYQRPPNRFVAAAGNNKKYDRRSVSILIHWNKNYSETEEHAFSVFETLKTIRNVTMGGTADETTGNTVGGTLVYYAIPELESPQDVGTDAKGVYEQVIWMDFYYQKGDEQ